MKKQMGRLNYWPSSVSNLPILTQRQFKGESKLDAFSIDNAFATDSKNLTSSGYPALQVRAGFSLLGAAFASKIIGMGVWKDSELHAVINGSWYKWTGSAWGAALASGLNASAEWSFANFKGNLAGIGLIGANGTDAIKKYDGAAVSDLATAPAGGNYIEQFADRLFCAVGNELHFTAYRMADDWTTVNGDDADSGYIIVETNNGETINAVRAGIGHLTVGKPNSIHELFGYSPSDFRMIPVTFEIGPLNNKCMITINGIMYILGSKGIYKYAGGTLPDKGFSLPVQWYIDNMNQTAKGTCCLGTDGQKLYVSIPMDSSTVPDTVLEFDPVFGTWYVWKDFTALFFAEMDGNWYQGDSAGKVMQMGGTTDNGTTIAWYWVSKPFGSGSLAQRLRWYRMWIVVDLPAGSTMNVYLSKSAEGDADWTLVKTLTASADIQNNRVIIPVDTVANANWIRVKFSGTGPATIYEFDRQEKDKPMV